VFLSIKLYVKLKKERVIQNTVLTEVFSILMYEKNSVIVRCISQLLFYIVYTEHDSKFSCRHIFEVYFFPHV
jgi:hypothetical protein